MHFVATRRRMSSDPSGPAKRPPKGRASQDRNLSAATHDQPSGRRSLLKTNPAFAGISSVLYRALLRTRTADPFLTMEVLYQLS
jgi:hypothetical protein